MYPPSQKILTSSRAVASNPPPPCAPARPATSAFPVDEADGHANLSPADQAALDAGYTRRVFIEGGCAGGEFLVRLDVDLDDRFRAWGLDWQEWTVVQGYNVLIEEAAL